MIDNIYATSQVLSDCSCHSHSEGFCLQQKLATYISKIASQLFSVFLEPPGTLWYVLCSYQGLVSKTKSSFLQLAHSFIYYAGHCGASLQSVLHLSECTIKYFRNITDNTPVSARKLPQIFLLWTSAPSYLIPLLLMMTCYLCPLRLLLQLLSSYPLIHSKGEVIVNQLKLIVLVK